MSDDRLAGRHAVVVGVGSAVGRACAVRLAASGASVVCVDPSEQSAKQLAEDLGTPSQFVVAEFDQPADAARVAGLCTELWGVLDILVDCGSAMETWPSDEDSFDRLAAVITVNALGPLAYTLALRPLLAASTVASVVYLGSIDGIRGNPTVPAYSMGKAALLPLTNVMAVRLGADGIRVNCIAAAGVVQVSAAAGPIERTFGDWEFARRMTPLGRMPSVDEIASVALFFASDDASYVTGTVLPVDGGRIAATPGTW